MIVTYETHPRVFDAFILLEGAMKSPIHMTRDDSVVVPEGFAHLVDLAEKELAAAQLSTERLEEFVNGDFENIADLVEAKGLRNADQLLRAYFERWYA